jgi:hypothetical protein
MKLDMDLVRAIMKDIEEHPEADGSSYLDLEYEGRTEREINYHVKRMHEAGLVNVRDFSNLRDGVIYKPTELTYAGHEFLATAANDTLWAKAKGVASNAGSALSIEGMKIALAVVLKHAIGG